VADVPEGYKDVPPEDRAKAKVFFDQGKTVAATGNYDYAITMFMNGFALDPDLVEAHQQLRDISLKRKASGGKAMGMFDAMKIKRPTNDDKQNMLNAEKLLAYDPGNTNHMQTLFQSAHRGGYFDTLMWIGPILQKANADDKKPDFNKFIVLRDIYKAMEQWRLAADACTFALRMRPDDMELSTEVKNLGAQDTMHQAGYEKKGSFRDQIRDKAKQERLMIGDKDFADLSAQEQLIAAAQAEYKADPTDPGKTSRYVEALEKTDHPDYENKAVELLQALYDKTQQYRYRQRIGNIQMKQLSRMERSKRAAVNNAPDDENIRKEYAEFQKEQWEFELKEFQMAAEAYPTEMRLKFEVGRRLYHLQRWSDAIPVFQTARQDPKYRADAGLMLGMAFLNAGFQHEAAETLAVVAKDYINQGDTKSKEIYYWWARSQEVLGNKQDALNLYSKVAQWDFNYRDVQGRIKKLRVAS